MSSISGMSSSGPSGGSCAHCREQRRQARFADRLDDQAVAFTADRDLFAAEFELDRNAHRLAAIVAKQLRLFRWRFGMAVLGHGNGSFVYTM
jgi:hypothetical protein